MVRSNIQLIKDTVEILDVAKEFIHMKKVGRSYTGLCPFHADRNPSFFVFPAKRNFKCFTCGEQGSVIDLYAQKEGVPFSRAVAMLEKELNLTNHYQKKFSSGGTFEKSPLKLSTGVFQILRLRVGVMRDLFEENKEEYFETLEASLLQEKKKREWAAQLAVDINADDVTVSSYQSKIIEVDEWLEVGVYAEKIKYIAPPKKSLGDEPLPF